MAIKLPNILIAAHTFPPSGGIGGRRWAKFAKYLRKEGAGVQVLTANLPRGNSPWTDDVARIPRNTYAHSFPKVLELSPNSFKERLSYRAALFRNKLGNKGTPYDRALYDGPAFLGALHQLLLRDKVDALVVTAAPFRLPWYALKLRNEFPEVKFIADFRDPWTTGESFGYQSISPKRKQFEASIEAAVVRGYDLVTSPWPALVDDLRRRYPDCAHRIALLPHCYDPDELMPRQKVHNAPLRIVYGGNMYHGLDKLFRSLSDQARAGNMQVDIWPSTQYAGLDHLVHSNFKIYPVLGSKAFYEEASRADVLLFPIPNVLRNGLPTKLYEFVASGVPIMATGYAGSLSQTIVENGLGSFVDIESYMSNWLDSATEAAQLKVDRTWVLPYEATSVTKKLLELIAKIDHEN